MPCPQTDPQPAPSVPLRIRLMRPLEELLGLGGTKKDVALLVLGALSLVVSLLDAHSGVDVWPLPFDAAWVAIVACGVPIVLEAVVGLVTAFDIRADVLVSLALVASVCIGEDFAAGEVAFIMQLGGLLEDLTVARARAGIERLVRLTPQTARVVEGGSERTVPAEQVRVGDVLRVLPGETVPVDGVVTAGASSIDQAVMTGESLPVDKAVGDEVCSGTVNQFGSFEMRATRVGDDSSIQRMVRLVQSADAGKAKIVRLADRWATWIVVIALSAAAVTWAVSGEIIRAVTILVVFCPCALVLATPTAVMAAIGNATKHGFLVREGDALERLARVTRVTFDKTGTLTCGTPRVVAVRACAGFAEDEVFSLAAAAEKLSEHPLGKAIARSYEERAGAGAAPVEAPRVFAMLPGLGVEAQVGGRTVLAGSARLLVERGVALPDGFGLADEKASAAAGAGVGACEKDGLGEKIGACEKAGASVGAGAGACEKAGASVGAGACAGDGGATVVHVAVDGILAGSVALADTVRPEARGIVGRLRDLGVSCVLLTGDRAGAAASIAAQTGIGDVRAQCLPEDKLDHIAQLQRAGADVCMVGDGVNDAPALKRADVGIAMGGVGSDIAVDAADIVLVDDEIKELPHLVALSRRMMTTIKLNLTFSLTLNFAAIILAIAGVLGPVVGALVHNAGSVLVIVNSALLLRWRGHPGTGAEGRAGESGR